MPKEEAERVAPPIEYPIDSEVQIDEKIITPKSRSSMIKSRRPIIEEKWKQFPKVDADGKVIFKKKKLHLKDDDGNLAYDKDGKPIIKEVITAEPETTKHRVKVIVGYETVDEELSADELFDIDLVTAILDEDDIANLRDLHNLYAFAINIQRNTGKDYSYFLHFLKIQAASIVNTSKGYQGKTLEMAKTRITKAEMREWAYRRGAETRQRRGLWGRVTGQRPEPPPMTEEY